MISIKICAQDSVCEILLILSQTFGRYHGHSQTNMSFGIPKLERE